MHFRFLAILFVFSIFKLSAQSINFSADTSSGCAPLQVSFSSSNANAQQYHWSFGDGSQSSVASPSHLYVDPGTYSVKLVVTTASGVDSIIKNSFIQVDSIPIINYTISDSVQCVNSDSISFTNLGNPSHTYKWSMGDGTILNAFEGTHQYQNVGSFQTTLFATSSAGCTNSKSLSNQIEVKPSPQVDFSVDTNLICSNNQVIQFASLAGSNLKHYWNFGDGVVDSINRNAQHVYQSEGAYTVSLTVSDSASCQATEIKQSLINYRKPQSPIIEISQDTICEGVNTAFLLDSNWVSSIWSFGNGDSSNQLNPSYAYADSGKYEPKVNLIDSIGCLVEHTLDSIDVHKSPVANVAGSAFSACVPYAMSLVNSSFFADQFIWDIDSTLSYQTDLNYSFTQAGSYDLELIAINDFCVDTLKVEDFATIESATTVIEVDDSSGCAPISVNFSLQGETFQSVKWYFGNGDSSSLQEPTYTYNLGGMFYPKVITETASGCKDTTIYSPGIQVIDAQSVFSLPDTVILCKPGFVQFNGYTVGGSFWQWDFGDGDSSNLANPSHYFDSSGTYMVELLTENTEGCFYRLKPYNVVVVKDQELDFNVKVTSCPFYKVEFTVLDSNATSWFWEFGNGFTDSVKNPTHYYGGPGYYNVSLSTSDKDGCFKKHTKLSGVQIFPCGGGGGDDPGLPGDPSGFGGGFNNALPPIKACAPFEIEMIMPFDSIVNQWWDFGDGNSSQLKAPTHTYTQGGSYTIQLIVEFPDGTIDTITNQNFIQLGSPKARFDFEIENECDSSLVNFVNQSSSASQFQWNLGIAGVSQSFQPSAIYKQESNQLISLKVLDSLGCSNKLYKNLTVGAPNPYFNFPTNSCLGDTINLYSNIQFYDSLSWQIGGYSFHGDTIQFLPLDTGEYTVVIQAFDQSGCFNTYTSTENLKIYDPQADFVINGDLESCDFLDLDLTNLSTGASKFMWYFGNGDSSNTRKPTYRITQEGSFRVSLTAEEGGCISEKIATEKVVVNKAKADFTVIQNEKCLPIQVQFYDHSDSAVSWSWNFGDGDSSIIKDPLHTYYQEPGTQSLQIVDIDGCVGEITKSAIELHHADPIANRWEGCVPLLVQFDDTTANVVEYKWLFGDGDSSNLKSPQHSYQSTGVYDLTLITRSVEGCYDTTFLSEAIVVGDVKADFNSISSGESCAPHLIELKNQCTGAVNYKWNFGDGNSSTQKHTNHVYHSAGHFDVRLIADNGHSCSDTLLKENRFNINTPKVNFTLSDSLLCGPSEVQFIDLSKRVASRTWFFGDGQTSQDSAPIHIFQDTGVYKVNLMVTDTAQCVEYLTKTVRVLQKPRASFSLDSVYGCIPVSMGFRNHSYELDQASFHWKVGNQWIKNTFDTTLVFSTAGSFDIALVAVNKNKCKDTLIKENHLDIYEAVPPKHPEVTAISRGIDQSWNLNWEANLANQFEYYKIWRKKANSEYELFLNIPEQNRTSYSISYRPSWQSKQCFKIESVYHCYPAEGPDSLIEYCSIDLSATAKTDFIELNWTPYLQIDFDYYELWRKPLAGGQYKKIASIPNTENTYADSNILCPEPYLYRISAVKSNNPIVAYSDTAMARANSNTLDSLNLLIKRATVVDENSVLLEWGNFNLSPQVVKHINLEKQQSRGGFVMLGQLDPSATSYFDRNASPNERDIQYLLTLEDNCSANLNIQDRASSIFLEVKQNGDQHLLRWTAAKGVKGGVSTYLIQRLDNEGNWEDLKRVNAEQLEAIINAE